jgi:hypothetical protein
MRRDQWPGCEGWRESLPALNGLIQKVNLYKFGPPGRGASASSSAKSEVLVLERMHFEL